MATCKLVTKNITYALTLNEKEAGILLTILGGIGGNPDGPRQHITDIFFALKDANVLSIPVTVSLGGCTICAID